MTIDSRYTTPKSLNDIKKLDNERAMFMIKCEYCSHTMPLIKADRKICTHCGHYVYRTPELKFKYKLKEQMINDNRRTNITRD